MKTAITHTTKIIRKTALAIGLMTAAISFAPGLAPQANAESGIVHLSSSQNTKTIRIGKAKPKTIRTDTSFSEIVVGDPDIAVVSPLTDRSFYVVGSQKGVTGIALYNSENELVGMLDIEVGPDTDKLNTTLRSALPSSTVSATSSNGHVVLKGKAKNAVDAAKARAIAQKYDKELIDTVKVKGSQQVKLEVRFLEAQRNNGKELGIGLTGNSPNDPTGGTVFNIPALGIVSNAIPYGQFVTRLIDAGTNVDVVVRALEQRGVARRLAEPNLVALSGDTASFLAGGEFPIPVSAEDGQITVEFKPFGVGLEFTPTVLDNGLIHMKLAPEVSQIDNTTSVSFGNGGQIPGIVVRRAETTLELRDGQSFVLGGLLQSNSTYDKSQLPWIGNVPILGALFRSAAYRKNETDLVIIVTPRLVKPLAPGDEPATPLDSSAPGNDVDLFVNGDLEVSRAHLRKLAEARSNVLKSGHIIELE